MPQPLIGDLTRTHYPQLDGLRGCAILAVMLYHFSLQHHSRHDPGIILGGLQFGWAGVDLFFVLSGFLITSILLATREQRHYFRNFLARRFLRIWPLYYLNLMAFFILAPLLLDPLPTQLEIMGERQVWFWLYAANWLFVREGGFNDTPGGYFWSLAVEEQFYVVWPLVIYFLSRRAVVITCIALLLLSLALRMVLLLGAGWAESSLYAMTFTHLDGVVTGSMLAVWLRVPEASAHIRRWRKPIMIASSTGLVSVVFIDRSLLFWNPAMALFGYTLIALFFGGLLACILEDSAYPRLQSLFTNPLLMRAGRYSYAMYLAHVPISVAVAEVMLSDASAGESSMGYTMLFIAYCVVALGFSWLVAVGSWYLFEKPVLSLKRYFSYK